MYSVWCVVNFALLTSPNITLHQNSYIYFHIRPITYKYQYVRLLQYRVCVYIGMFACSSMCNTVLSLVAFAIVFFIAMMDPQVVYLCCWNLPVIIEVKMLNQLLVNCNLKSTNSSVYEHVSRRQTTKFLCQ